MATIPFSRRIGRSQPQSRRPGINRVIKVFQWISGQDYFDATRPEHRRARVLNWILITLIPLIAVTELEVYFLTQGPEERRLLYFFLLSFLLGLMLLAFALIRLGKYSAAAGITVICSLLGPWGSVALEGAVHSGDYVPLVYTSLSLFLSAFLLRVGATVALSIVQFLALFVLSFMRPFVGSTDWPSLLAFILFTSVLSIVFTIISRKDMEQIQQQNELLADSEARMRELSVRDPLTGLYNRRFMQETLEAELEQAAQRQAALAVVMVDVDYFKRFNDTYGHVEGDGLLRLLGASFRAHIRKADVVCRYGGEEFVIILPDTNRSSALICAQRLQENARQIQIENGYLPQDLVSLSLGVAVYPMDGQNVEAILRAADDALYRAKKGGRDRIEIADGLLEYFGG